MAVKVSVYGTADMTQITRAREELNKLESTVKQSEGGIGGVLSRLQSNFNKTADAGGGMVAKTGAIAGIAASLTGSLTSSLGDLARQAIITSDSTDKFKQTLDFAGIDPATISTLTEQTRKYADQTVYDLSTIQNTTAQLAANGVPDYEKLTEAAGNLNAVSGGNADTFKSVGMVLTQTAGAGKLTTENWNQLSDAIPGASGKIQEALLKNGAYTGNFRDAMEKGQISSEEFNKALMDLGSQPVAVEAAKSTSTFEGALGNLQATITGKLADAMNAIKPVLTGVITGIGDFVNFVTSNTPVFVGLATFFTVLLAPAIWAAVVAVWSFTVALLANPLTWIALGIAAVVAGIILLAQNWDAVAKWIGDVWSGFTKWLGDSFDAIGRWWHDLWAGVGNFVRDAWTNVVNWIRGAVDGFVGFWRDAWGNVGRFFGSIWDKIRDALGNAGRWLVDVGKNIVEGLWNGLKSSWDWLVNMVKGLVDGFVGGIKDLLGIHSPSLVFAGIGSNIAAGMAKGIADGAPAVSNALGNLTASGTASISVSGSGTPSFGSSSSRSVVVAEGAIQISFGGGTSVSDAKNVVQDAFAQLVRELRAS